jgi:hypothetical protein
MLVRPTELPGERFWSVEPGTESLTDCESWSLADLSLISKWRPKVLSPLRSPKPMLLPMLPTDS